MTRVTRLTRLVVPTRCADRGRMPNGDWPVRRDAARDGTVCDPLADSRLACRNSTPAPPPVCARDPVTSVPAYRTNLPQRRQPKQDDPQASLGRLPPLFAQGRSAHREAAQSGDLSHARGGGEARARGAVL